MSSQQLARIVYHVPFCKMARKAHAHLRRVELEARAGAALGAEALAAEESAGARSFEAQVAPSLVLASLIGNTYTGSLYLGLTSLIHRDGESLAGKRVGMFSYGSGCSSEFFCGVVGPEAKAVVARAGIDGLLRSRTRIDVAEYERIMALPKDASSASSAPAGAFRFAGVRDDRRTYVGGPATS
jgi:hydroxymethylglutaryl-CoA synthase